MPECAGNSRNPGPIGATIFAHRVVAVAGDRIEIDNESLRINGKELERYRVPDESLTLFGEQVRGQVSYEVNSGRRYLVAYGDSPSGEPVEIAFEGRGRHVGWRRLVGRRRTAGRGGPRRYRALDAALRPAGG